MKKTIVLLFFLCCTVLIYNFAKQNELSMNEMINIITEHRQMNLQQAAVFEPTLSVTTNGQTEYDEVIEQLSEGFKSREKQFSVNIKAGREEIQTLLPEILKTAIRREQYSAYILDSYTYSVKSWLNYSQVTVDTNYRETPEQTEYVDHKISEVLSSILHSNMNDHEKVKAVHDWIVTHVQYDETLQKYTAYEALAEGETVCQGYALLAYKMLQASNIPVLILEGNVDTGAHAWNMVQLEGQWYHLDLTWDDPVGQAEDEVSYRYYLVSDEQLKKDHSWTIEYPIASMNYNEWLLTQIKNSTDTTVKQFYEEMRKSLDMHWGDDEFTITTLDELEHLLITSTNEGLSQLKFRYTKGDQFEEHLQLAMESISIRSAFQAEYIPYTNNGSILVTINIQQ